MAEFAPILAVGLVIGAAIYILFFREDQFTRYSGSAGCRCGHGFIPNPHDDLCTVCRRGMDANTISPPDWGSDETKGEN